MESNWPKERLELKGNEQFQVLQTSNKMFLKVQMTVDTVEKKNLIGLLKEYEDTCGESFLWLGCLFS